MPILSVNRRYRFISVMVSARHLRYYLIYIVDGSVRLANVSSACTRHRTYEYDTVLRVDMVMNNDRYACILLADYEPLDAVDVLFKFFTHPTAVVCR
jgi:hypothetical protein